MGTRRRLPKLLHCMLHSKNHPTSPTGLYPPRARSWWWFLGPADILEFCSCPRRRPAPRPARPPGVKPANFQILINGGMEQQINWVIRLRAARTPGSMHRKPEGKARVWMNVTMYRESQKNCDPCLHEIWNPSERGKAGVFRKLQLK